MSAITPSTDLYLLKSPIEIDMNNQLTFANATAQANYFSSLPKLEVEDISYQRKDSVIRFPAHIDNLLQYNYVMYKNDNYSNKWFYAFITDMQYLNDNCTAIFIKTDPYQTWMFDLQFKQSFVEREHVSDDTFGLHTLSEDMPTGATYVMNAGSKKTIAGADPTTYYIAIQVTEDLLFNRDAQGKTYNGLPQGTTIILFDPNEPTGKSSFSKVVNYYARQGKSDSIVSAFIVPKSLIGDNKIDISFSDPFQCDCSAPSNTPASTLMFELNYSRKSTLDGYTPKNNKLFCYPYHFFEISNGCGENVTYNFEDFTGNPNLRCLGVVSQGCSIRAIPSNYIKQGAEGAGFDYGINGGKLPIISWQSDYYLNWQAKNGVNSVLDNIDKTFTHFADNLYNTSSPIGAGGSENVKNVVNIGVAGAGYIKSLISGKEYDASITPKQANGNVSCGDLSFSYGTLGFTYKEMSVKYEYAKMIDDFFSAFGYKVNSYKLPNITGRQNWNYVKCVDVNIEGDIPQMFMQEIKAMFDKGVTLWHNPATFLDYSQNNPIV